MKDIMTVAVVNFRVDAANKESNLSRMCGYAEAAAKRGADLVLLPELCLYGWDYYVDMSTPWEEKVQTAEKLDGPSCAALSEVAEKYGIYIVFGMAEKLEDAPDAALYNAAVTIGPEGVIGAYHKMHTFEQEGPVFTKGDEPFMFDTPWGPVGIGICFDTYQFPELQRHYCAKGCRLYLNPTAFVEEVTYDGSREAFLNTYAQTLEYGVLCNTIYVATSNLTGKDIDSYFGGGSSVIGPKISPFYETMLHYYAGDKNSAQAELYLATIDLSLAGRRLFVEKEDGREPDYRPEVYKKFL